MNRPPTRPWSRRLPALAALVALVALGVGTGAFASGSAIPVSLRIAGSADRNVGQSVRLTATARLPLGGHLMIQALRLGKLPAKVAECLRSPCSASFRDTKVEDVAFQASASKRVGTKITSLGRSQRVTVSWVKPAPPLPPPPPPPPPPPAATPGHFSGTIGNARAPIAFDIGSDGISMVNLSTGEIDESCDPATYTFWFDGFSGSGPFPVATNGAFLITGSGSDPTLDYTFKLTGTVTGASASGILHVESSYLLKDGNRLNCSSGDQPWTATKTG